MTYRKAVYFVRDLHVLFPKFHCRVDKRAYSPMPV
ncbi:hypothetical protein EVA_03964 [gut metagenome]|uniref:Uncharacterized protein n=1 Tax=gut metagenome TaxID=749906 RepID=J9GXS6_9ZZZZ